MARIQECTRGEILIWNCRIKACNISKIVLQRGCVRRNFLKFAEQLFCYLWTAASLINLDLHRYFYIFRIHFNFSQSKSDSCSQVYVLIGIKMLCLSLMEYIVLPYCLYFVLLADLKYWRLIIQTWYNANGYTSLLVDWLNCISQLENNQSQSSQLANCCACISKTSNSLIAF